MPATRADFVCLQTRGFDPIPGVRLPPVDEESLVLLATKVAQALVPGYSPGTGSAWLRRNEEEDVGVGVYTRTSERQHGGKNGVRFLEVLDCSSDAAGPSTSEIHRSVSVPGWPSGTEINVSVHIRPQPFHNAGLRVEASLACPSEERLALASAILEATFGPR